MIFWVTAPSITATQRAYQREFGVRNPPKRNTMGLGQIGNNWISDVHCAKSCHIVHHMVHRWSMVPFIRLCDDRIISRNLWPPRSPDLTTPDNICYRASQAEEGLTARELVNSERFLTQVGGQPFNHSRQVFTPRSRRLQEKYKRQKFENIEKILKDKVFDIKDAEESGPSSSPDSEILSQLQENFQNSGLYFHKNDAETDRKRKRNWLGHWLRRNCLLKDALEGMVNGRRVRGRRRYQMIDDIKIYGSYEETKRKADNRKDWRKLSLHLNHQSLENRDPGVAMTLKRKTARIPKVFIQLPNVPSPALPRKFHVQLDVYAVLRYWNDVVWSTPSYDHLCPRERFGTQFDRRLSEPSDNTGSFSSEKNHVTLETEIGTFQCSASSYDERVMGRRKFSPAPRFEPGFSALRADALSTKPHRIPPRRRTEWSQIKFQLLGSL
ncbi:hypothetical protein ANN_07119 [Periplaneta americana]|uniref:DUF4817 domain-containing protein n=1 Tax=Periplaneta americana TaxID=6978 RepID=A0ABQ8TFH7_PERAM|nr:hypothetical protein ANN_07119 [Periplaneta americana]